MVAKYKATIDDILQSVLFSASLSGDRQDRVNALFHAAIEPVTAAFRSGSARAAWARRYLPFAIGKCVAYNAPAFDPNPICPICKTPYSTWTGDQWMARRERICFECNFTWALHKTAAAAKSQFSAFKSDSNPWVATRTCRYCTWAAHEPQHHVVLLDWRCTNRRGLHRPVKEGETCDKWNAAANLQQRRNKP